MRCSIPRPFLALAALGLLAAAPAAHAQNLVSNPGFETGDFSGWTQLGQTTFIAVDAFAAHSGTFGAVFGPAGATGGISQGLVTTPGSLYTVSFWLRNFSGTPNFFEASFGGTPLMTMANSPGFAYTQFSFAAPATANSSTLRFTFQHDPNVWNLDDVSVVATQAVVPEPGTVVLLASGLAGLGAVAARRRRRAVAAERA